MDIFLQFTVAGLATGCIYALTATGLTVTYITSGIFNFAHGAVGMIAAFTYWELTVEHGWPQFPAVLVVLFVLAPIMGLLIEQLMRRLHGAPTEVTLVITLGILLALIGVAQTRWDPGEARVLTEFFSGRQVAVLGVNVTYHQLLVMAITVAVVIGLRLFLYRTRAGIALRAVVDAPDVAALNGAAPDRVSQMGWVIGAMLAALAGVLLAPILGAVDIIFLTLLVINGYAAAIAGRLRSLPLTFGGGLALGLIESYVIWIAPSKSWWIFKNPVSDLHVALPILFLFLMLLLVPEARLRVGRTTTRRPLRIPSLRDSIVGAVALVGVGWIVSGFLSTRDQLTMGRGLILTIVMLSLVLLTGYGGQISLCQLTFVGVGAFAMGKVAGGHSILGMFAAVGLSAAVGALIALPALRLRGLYLALSTFAFAQVMTALFFKRDDVFSQGGALGVGRISLFGLSLRDGRRWFMFLVVVLAITAVGVLAVRRSSLGRRLVAMSDSPAACATVGMSLVTTKLAVFAASAGLAGLAGALYGGNQGSVGSFDFEVLLSSVLLLQMVIWGVDSVLGVVIAGSLIALFPTIEQYFPGIQPGSLQYLATGVGVILLSRQPGGIVRMIGDSVNRVRAGFEARRPTEETETVRPRPRPRPRSIDDPTPVSVPALELRGIKAGYGGIEVVHGVDLVVPPASVFALLGPNGAGKTTLLKVASCQKLPTEGCVHISGIHVNGASPEAIARLGVCTIPEGRGIFANLSVAENLRMMTFREGIHTSDVEERALARFPALRDKRERIAGTLSGGEQQMLAMARAVATEPKLLLLDEISMGLAPLIVAQMYDLVGHLAAEGFSLLIVEQFAHTALQYADYAAVMVHGEIRLVGQARDVAPVVEDAYFGAPV